MSYGATWTATRSTTVAVLPIGYADGLPRRMSGCAQVLIASVRCPVIGVITMGMMMVDVTDVNQVIENQSGSRVSAGDEVVILGQQGSERITTREFAAWAGCIEYEVTCGISKRVPRVYNGA